VYAEFVFGSQEVPCEWLALCENPANGLRDHPVLGEVPICQRCDDKVERLGE
jgi:hypothetical protein